MAELLTIALLVGGVIVVATWMHEPRRGPSKRSDDDWPESSPPEKSLVERELDPASIEFRSPLDD